jgi:hypothetical protein
MRNEDQFIGGDFTWFTAVVEDIDDPDNLNRVKVRCHGWHSTNTSIVSTENLPWATVMMPVTSASIQGNGGNHHLEVGSWVVGFFRDGPSAQDPMVMGSIATQTNGTQDIPTESSVDNKVYKSKAGHLIEIDNKDGGEEIRVTHKTGSYIKFLNDGTIEIKSLVKTRII